MKYKVGDVLRPKDSSECGSFELEDDAVAIRITKVISNDYYYDILDEDGDILDSCYGCFRDKDLEPVESTTPKFKVGDRVIHHIKGMGTIFETGDNIGVEYDQWRGGWHKGTTPNGDVGGNCWYEIHYNIKLVSRPEEELSRDLYTKELLKMMEASTYPSPKTQQWITCNWSHLDGGLTGFASGTNITAEKPQRKGLMTQLSNIAKRLVDSDTKTLIKAGYVDSCLDLTGRGKDALVAILFEANKKELVTAAKAQIKEDQDEE